MVVGARPVQAIRRSRPTLEGAGVHLQRVFGQVDPLLDPFLLLDDFGSADPRDYVAGFPWHPHRGIVTITYLLAGAVDHGDSLGNRGRIGAGDAQWMTAGSGIIHEEMPAAEPGLRGLQLWLNLAAAEKMTPPRYRDVRAATLPSVALGPGAEARLLCGRLAGVVGPVDDAADTVDYIDLRLAPAAPFDLPVAPERNAFAYVLAGSVLVAGEPGARLGLRELGVLGPGASFQGAAGADGAQVVVVSGRPLREPVAWGGPIVMNTEAELQAAFAEYRAGTFIRHPVG